MTTTRGEPLRFIREIAVPYQGDDCLTWPFARITNGYGSVWYEGKVKYPHRIVCELAHGPAPSPRHEAAHSCGKGHEGCVNPRHLRWATPKENNADKVNHGTTLRGERSARAKLSAADVRQIRAQRGRETQQSLGNRFGVSPRTIEAIHLNKIWKEVQ